MSTEGIVAVLGGIAAAIAVAVPVLIKAFQARATNRHIAAEAELERKLRERADVIREWQEYAANLETRLAETNSRVSELTKQFFDLQRQHADCRGETAALKGELKLQEAALRRLQAHTGDIPPATVLPGVIVAGLDGTILVVSPALTAFLHWLPADLKGKSIETLIPARYLADHRKGMEALKATGVPPWTERVILGQALTKEGGEVPVKITLSAWQDPGHKAWLLSAEIARRPQTALHQSAT